MKTEQLLKASIATILFVFGRLSLSAQQPPLAFKAGVDAIPVDVTVLDATGRPVTGLTAADFTLDVDGRRRPIVSVDYVDARRITERPPDAQVFSTNAGQRPGRLIALVIDEGHIARGQARAAFDAAKRFIQRLDPADRVALYLIPGSGPVTAFTPNHGLVLRLLDRAAGQSQDHTTTGSVGIAEAIEILDRPPNPDSPTGAPPGSLLEAVFSRECAGENDTASLTACRRRVEAEARTVFTATRARTTRTLTALRGLFDRLAGSNDTKTVVLLTQGLVLGRDMSEIAWVGPLASRAQVTLYGLRLDGELFDASSARISPSRREDNDLASTGLDQLVGSANGTVLPMAVSASAVFSQLETELSGYYLLSFAPDAGDRDGRPHRIDVRAGRPGLRVQARREFTLTAQAPQSRDAQLTAALLSPLGLTDFGLAVTTWHFPDADARSRRVKALITARLDRRLNRESPVAVAWTLTNPEGRMIAGEDAQVLPALPAGTPPSQTYAGAVVVDPGVYHLTLAAVDDQGRRATVSHAFDARLTGVGQVRLSDVLLTGAGARTSASPLVDDAITSGTLGAYVEVSSEVPLQLDRSTLSLEIAASEDGRVLESAPMRFLDGGSPTLRRAEGTVPVALLADGTYVARVVLASSGRAVGRVSRPWSLARGTGSPAAPAPPVPDPAIPIAAFDLRPLLSRQSIGIMLDHLQPASRPPLPDALLPALGLSRIGRFTDARAIAEQSGLTHHAVPFFIGLGALAAGDLNTAVQAFADALKLAPDLLPATFYLGACYAAAGRDADATLAWRTGLLTDPRAPWTYTTMADALLRTQNVRLALDLLTAATAQWPADTGIRARLGAALLLAGQPVDAVRMLTPVLAAGAPDRAHWLLGLRALHLVHAGGQSVESRERDLATFDLWVGGYERAGGTERDLVAGWRKAISRD